MKVQGVNFLPLKRITTKFFRSSRTPTLLQRESSECGAICLGIILGYYGRIVSPIELRDKCGVSRDGVTAKNIVKAAQSYGLNTKAFRASGWEIKNFRLPSIVFWKSSHFVVVESFNKNWVNLNDPATGRRQVTLTEFSQSYSGIVLEIEPGANFEKGGEKRNLFSYLYDRLKNSHDAVLFSLLAGLMLTFPRLIVPIFSLVFVDEVLVQNNQDWLRPLLLGMIVTVIVKSFLANYQFRYLRRLIIKLSIAMNAKFVWHTLRLPMSFYTQRLAGEISDRAILNDEVITLLSRIASTVIDTVTIGFYALLAIAFDWQLATIVFILASLNFVALEWLRRYRLDSSLSLTQEKGKLYGISLSSIQLIETAKASGFESYLFTQIMGIYSKVINLQQKLAIQTQILTVIPTLLTSLSTATILVFGGLKVMDGNMSIGMLVAFGSLVDSFLKPINNLINFAGTLQVLEASLERLDDVLQNPIDSEFNHQKSAAIARPETNSFQLKGQIELRDITFGYNLSKPPLIENFNLIVKPGERVALVGKTGSGKSTISKLICGLYQPRGGEILFDNIPRSEISRSVLANSLAMVEQDIFLFAGTIRENLTLWNPTVPDSCLVRACQDAAIHDFIISLPGGYDAMLIEGGKNLSGGQRQRLEIARALVLNPAILILDEATSNLDSETESIIIQNLRRRGCSCIVVAHRLSTIRDCDKILVLDLGKVVQNGNHKELWQQGGIYARLLLVQQESESIDSCSKGKIQQQLNTKKESIPLTKAKSSAKLPVIIRDRIDRLAENQSLLLNEPNTVWVLVSGTIDLFYSHFQAGEPIGNLRYLFSVSAKEAIFGAVEEEGGILAVAIEGAEIQKLDLATFAARISLANPEAIAQLESWVSHLGNIVSANYLRSPQNIIPLNGGNAGLSLLNGQVLQPSLDRLVWIDLQQGSTSWLGVESLNIDSRSPLFPLTADTWLEARTSVKLNLNSTNQLKNVEQNLPTSIEILNRYFYRYLKIIGDREKDRQFQRFCELQTLKSQLTRQTMTDLAAVLNQKQQKIYDQQEPLLIAAGAVGKAMGINIVPPRKSESLDKITNPIAAIARASGFSIRTVALAGNWWLKEQGPLLAYTREDNSPVALLPDKNKRYQLFEPKTQTRTQLERQVAATLAPKATMFYRPLPEFTKKVIEIFQFSIKGYEIDILWILAIGTIATLLGMIVPQGTAILVDNAIPDSDRLLLTQIGLGLLAAAFGKSAFELARGFVALRVETAAEINLHPAICDRLFKLPSSFFRQYTSGDLLTRLMAISLIRSQISDATQRTILNGLFSLLNLGLMLYYSIKLTMVVVGITLLAVLVTIISGLLLVRKERKQEKLIGEINGFTVQLINGVQKLRVAGAEERGFAAWGNKYLSKIKLTDGIQKINDIVAVFNEILPLIASILIFWFAILFMDRASGANSSELTMGKFLAFQSAFTIFISGVTSLSNTLTNILEILPLWERAKPIVQDPLESDRDRSDPGNLVGAVSLENISFRYDKDRSLILDDISLHAAPGEFVAIVGPTGSGKSTILRLLLGFETPLSGTVNYDGKNLPELDLQAVRQQIGVVLQNGKVVQGSIFDNITCGGVFSRNLAWEALQMSGLAEDIEQMPMGMETLVSEGGSNLSVGQRQRLMIARSLIAKPKILLLDEATSALDNNTQAIVTQNLQRLNITRITIAHRLSTIRHADRIYVIDAGRVVQVGSFEELVQQNGLFTRLVNQQLS